MYVSTQEDLQALIDQIRDSPILAIDTEFHSEKTYYAKLCLIQIGTGKVNALVDPLQVKDLTPLSELFSNPNMVKVFHAGNQDIDILQRAVGVVPSPIFDTQIAAGLLGHPQQLGYGALVKAFCNVVLPKADSFTDWTRRPLSGAQVEYAINDVLFLPDIYSIMQKRLREAGRLEWLQYDFAHLSDPATYEMPPDQMWKRVRRVSTFTRKQLAALQAATEWREITARKRNIPRKWVLPDEILVEIGRRAPTTSQSLLEIRGISERLANHSLQELLSAISISLARDPELWPKLNKGCGKQREVEGAVDLMIALLHLRARENSVTVQFLGSRDDMVKLAKGEGDDLPVMSGWRYKLVGKELCDLLEGKLYLHIEDGILQVTKAVHEE